MVIRDQWIALPTVALNMPHCSRLEQLQKGTAQGLTGSTPGTIRHRHRTSTLLGGPHKDPSTAAADLETDQKRAYCSGVGVGHD